MVNWVWWKLIEGVAYQVVVTDDGQEVHEIVVMAVKGNNEYLSDEVNQ